MTNSCNSKNNNFETLVRAFFTGKVEDVHGHGTTDLVYHGQAYEIKSAHGWLINPFGTKEQATALKATNFKMPRAKYVIYAWNAEIADAHVMTQKEFLDILRAYNKIRVKSQSSAKGAKFGLAIQQYIGGQNSAKVFTEITNAIAKYPTLAEWKATH